MNLATWVARNGRRSADVHADWATFAARVAAIAGGLRDRFALHPGERVAVVMHNRVEYLEALFAIWHAGLVAVPDNARLHRAEISFILEQSGSRMLIADAEHADDASSLIETVETLGAFVVAADAGNVPPVEELDQLCLDHIARYKRPKDYRFVESLPTNNYGKVVKRELREQPGRAA